MYMEFFESALVHVLKSEGGYTNHPNDKGGPTNWGITQADYSSFLGRPATADDVKAMTIEEASAIYKKKYWDAMKLERIRDREIALILFDQGVNRGTKTAIKNLQTVLNESFGEKLEVDGVLGNRTDVAIATAPKRTLCRKLLQNAVENYCRICIKNPSQLVFLLGWINRVDKLADEIG